MDAIQKLTEIFKQFPGIGPRQAKRFVYFLLGQENSYNTELSKLVSELQHDISCCTSCYRFFVKNSRHTTVCSICADTHRDKTAILIVSRDVDFENIEKTRTFTGYYFILGGTVPILAPEPASLIHQKELMEVISKRSKAGLKEVILAFDLNPEGEHTREYIQQILGPLSIKHGFTISLLGRGLSMGSELEYSDTDTLKSALNSRK